MSTALKLAAPGHSDNHNPSQVALKPVTNCDIFFCPASQQSQGLALAFPVIAARPEGGAVLAYAYGGNTDIRLDGSYQPAYAGEAFRALHRATGSSDVVVELYVWTA